MFLTLLKLLHNSLDLLHARGGVSYTLTSFCVYNGSSPRTWRCFHIQEKKRCVKVIFSTHVEVFPTSCQKRLLRPNLLHARGGVSDNGATLLVTYKSSPRTWRCFLKNPFFHLLICIFSTHVEVFPTAFIRSANFLIFSTHVEVFPCSDSVRPLLLNLLHARGGVSKDGRITKAEA